MPIYEYECLTCELPFEKQLPMAEYNAPQACPECGGEARRMVSMTSFVLKGDDWTSKNLRVKSQMAAKNARLDQKARDHVAPISPPLTPNVGGEQVDSWSEAKKLAASQGKDASSYDPMIKQEKTAR